MEAASHSAEVIFPVLPPTAGRESAAALAGNDYASAPVVVPGALTHEECNAILHLGSQVMVRPGAMINGRPGHRRSAIAWIDPSPESEWVYRKFADLALWMNTRFQFEIAGFVDSLQYTVYEEGDQFDWHLDTGPGTTSMRKFSLSLQLSDPATYEGGALEFCALGEPRACRGRGTVVMFPSFLGHRVTRVTRGRRVALVSWIYGPPFR